MSLINSTFIELQVKEHREYLEKEARQIQMLRSAGKKNGKIKRRCVETFANILISFGESLKRKYCPVVSAKADSSIYLSPDTCGY